MTTTHLYFEGLTQHPQRLQRYSALAVLMAKGRVCQLSGPAYQSLQAKLASYCDVKFSFDCPVAAITQLGETETVDNDYWLLATPVHLTLQRDFFSLTESLVPSEGESQAFMASLNAHFAEAGYTFIVTPSQKWLLKSATKHELSTSPVAQVLGRDTRPYLPKGADAAWAAQLTNEIQMLLFDHPVNQAREARGELAVNSIWLSGAGVLPDIARTENAPVIYADNLFAKGLSRLCQCHLRELSESFTQCLSHQKSTQDSCLWIDLAQSNHDWFAEILQLLGQRKLKHVTLYVEVAGKVIEITLTHWDVWKFWRKPKPLPEFLHRYFEH